MNSIRMCQRIQLQRIGGQRSGPICGYGKIDVRPAERGSPARYCNTLPNAVVARNVRVVGDLYGATQRANWIGVIAHFNPPRAPTVVCGSEEILRGERRREERDKKRYYIWMNFRWILVICHIEGFKDGFSHCSFLLPRYISTLSIEFVEVASLARVRLRHISRCFDLRKQWKKEKRSTYEIMESV